MTHSYPNLFSANSNCSRTSCYHSSNQPATRQGRPTHHDSEKTNLYEVEKRLLHLVSGERRDSQPVTATSHGPVHAASCSQHPPWATFQTRKWKRVRQIGNLNHLVWTGQPKDIEFCKHRAHSPWKTEGGGSAQPTGGVCRNDAGVENASGVISTGCKEADVNNISQPSQPTANTSEHDAVWAL